jgi:hypothetical protein
VTDAGGASVGLGEGGGVGLDAALLHAPTTTMIAAITVAMPPYRRCVIVTPLSPKS